MSAFVATAGGCMTEPGTRNAALTVNRANWVAMEIPAAMSMGALTEASLIRLVNEDGGGYVTLITISGPRGTSRQRTTIDAVLGTSVVRNPPQGGNVNGGQDVPVVMCFQFTVGWADTKVSPPVRRNCPEAGTATIGTGASAAADAGAAEINSAQNLAATIDVPPGVVPGSRTDALKVLDSGPAASHGLVSALRRMSYAGKSGIAAAAVPDSGGGCVYISFTRDGIATRTRAQAWAAPLDAPCTGAGALAASGTISYNPAAGG